MNQQIYVIDGDNFTTLQGFYDEISRVLIPGAEWGHNLDAFNDILRGGFGTPEGGFVLRWENSALSRQRLGYAKTIKWLEERIPNCHPSNVPHLEQRLSAAKEGRGETLFDTLIEIIQTHGIGGAEEEDGVELELV